MLRSLNTILSGALLWALVSPAVQASEALSSNGGTEPRTSHSRIVVHPNHRVDGKWHRPGGEWEMEPKRPPLVAFVGINTGISTKARCVDLTKGLM
eukprot:3583893-Pyramimonas_sp.AAC.1